MDKVTSARYVPASKNMALRFSVKWNRPARLQKSNAPDKLYEVVGIDRIPKTAGVYVFGRRYGTEFIPLYVGQATRLRGRIRRHVEHGLKLMLRLSKEKKGHRFVYYGEVKNNPGASITKALNVAERALLEHYTSEGYELFNKQGVRRRAHTIKIQGGKQLGLPRTMKPTERKESKKKGRPARRPRRAGR